MSKYVKSTRVEVAPSGSRIETMELTEEAQRALTVGLLNLSSCDAVGDFGCTEPTCERCHPPPSVCRLCGKPFGRHLCIDGAHVDCVAVTKSLATLAHNIAWGAALCASFDLGKKYGSERVVASWNGGGWTYPFEPGCGKAAP